MKNENEHEPTDYRDLLVEFGEDVISERIDSLKEKIEEFIQARGFSGKLMISDRNLNLVVLSYYSDIKRLKSFHGIKATSNLKIHSYTAFWLLRKKPIQVLEDFDGSERINERFVAFLLVDFLLREWAETVLTGDAHEQFIEFSQTLYYTFSYRNYSAQSIELVLIAFIAGVAIGFNLPETTDYNSIYSDK